MSFFSVNGHSYKQLEWSWKSPETFNIGDNFRCYWIPENIVLELAKLTETQALRQERFFSYAVDTAPDKTRNHPKPTETTRNLP